ncbi:MAG TPA: hypothetical protein GX391_08910 [Firmicutes bacterium]|jgi:hypothetical protein|nr:hypothetical protein [Bacillota bacterium]HOQ24545.1 hypothetical protein [Bacillota bacterium]HPT67798.1 hypothetical protein [Bacillota bacterium]
MIRLHVTADASGAAEAGARGDVVVIVDVIDMSTTAEALWEEGVLEVFGAAVDGCRVPVKVDPEMMGYLAGQAALARSCGVVVVAEPRVATEEERCQRCRLALAGLERAGVRPEGIYPNLGAETVKQFTARNKVALLVTDTGGAAFDAAWQAGATVVTTATVARTMGRRGQSPALAGVQRSLALAKADGKSITFVAASANSLEDVLAAEYLANLALAMQES